MSHSHSFELLRLDFPSLRTRLLNIAPQSVLLLMLYPSGTAPLCVVSIQHSCDCRLQRFRGECSINSIAFLIAPALSATITPQSSNDGWQPMTRRVLRRHQVRMRAQAFLEIDLLVSTILRNTSLDDIDAPQLLLLSSSISSISPYFHIL